MPAERLSLYIELEAGQKADLEIASRAAIAFAETIREIAAFIDPFSDIKIELVDTTEGSLSFNTKIKFRSASGTKEITVYALLVVFASFMAGSVTTFVADKALTSAWEQMFGSDEASLSAKDKQDIADRAAAAIIAKAGEQQSKQIFAELDKDPAVAGVGISRTPGARPSVMVPKSEFAKRSGSLITEEPADKKRKNIVVRDVILVSPVLEPDRKRRWKFRIDSKEFGAPIKDNYFLDAVFSGKHPILLKGNIRMKVRLEIQEEFLKGVWTEKDYIVWHVYGVPGQYQGPQQSLSFDERPETRGTPKPRK